MMSKNKSNERSTAKTTWRFTFIHYVFVFKGVCCKLVPSQRQGRILMFCTSCRSQTPVGLSVLMGYVNRDKNNQPLPGLPDGQYRKRRSHFSPAQWDLWESNTSLICKRYGPASSSSYFHLSSVSQQKPLDILEESHEHFNRTDSFFSPRPPTTPMRVLLSGQVPEHMHDNVFIQRLLKNMKEMENNMENNLMSEKEIPCSFVRPLVTRVPSVVTSENYHSEPLTKYPAVLVSKANSCTCSLGARYSPPKSVDKPPTPPAVKSKGALSSLGLRRPRDDDFFSHRSSSRLWRLPSVLSAKWSAKWLHRRHSSPPGLSLASGHGRSSSPHGFANVHSHHSIATQTVPHSKNKKTHGAECDEFLAQEWVGGVRALRDLHLRLVLRQLRHIDRLNRALDRAFSLSPCTRSDMSCAKSRVFGARDST